MKERMTRRTFLKTAGIVAAAAAFPVNRVEVAHGQKPGNKFTFAYISDSHLTQIQGTEFVRNFDNRLKKTVLEVNFMDPKPNFVIFGGDLAQLGKKEEFEHGLEIRQFDV
jgi:Icc protein